MTYTFKATDGRKATVNAASEDEARHLAMVQLHGPARYNYTWPCDRYQGFGLTLEEAR
jgi:hypothetical protein